MLGVVNVAPVARAVPPVEAANQLMVPAEAAAARAIVPVPQLEPGVVEVITGAAFTVAVTMVRAAEVHPPETAST